MAEKERLEPKALKERLAKLRRELDGLKKERLESLQQLRLGASTDVRKPTRLRRRIAALLGGLRQLELEAGGPPAGKDSEGEAA